MEFSNLKKSCCFHFKVMARWLKSFVLRCIIPCLLISIASNTVLAQKVKGNGGNKDIIPVVTCVKDLTTGLYQASFGYENPTNKEVVVDENGSIIKTNNGKRVAKGLNKFKPGSANKVFTKEFGPGDFVEWTIVSNGNTHTVIANANSSKCPVDDGFIEPVLFNGKSTDIIGQELSSLCDSPVELIPSPLIFQIKDEKVLIEIVPIDGQLTNLITLLKGSPFNIPDSEFLLYDPLDPDPLITQLSQFAVVDVYFLKQDLCLLNDYPLIVNFARPVYPATTNSTGILTQGDAAQKSNIVRDIFRTVDGDGGIVPVDGTGITVGVLSDSYDTAFGGPYAPLDVGNGELPDDVVLLKDNASDATDEGRAMMQIIHDVAPGSKIQFHTATASPRQFEEGFNALAIESDIIVDDITFITEPFFIGNGKIATAVQSFVNQPGKFHFTSAGNLANKAYQSTFAPTAAVPVTNFIPEESPTRAHLFDGIGGSDYLQEISVVPGTYLVALQWKELLASQGDSGALEDLDIYIVDDLGRLLVGSNRVNIAGDPTEIIVFRATGSGTANLMITSANGPTNVPFRYIAFYTADANGNPDGLQFGEYFANGAPTVSGHAMIPNSVTTGAVDYRRANAPVAETFSSFGGTLSDNTELLVDLYAPDGGNTASTTIGQDAQCPTCDNDGILNFYGTSAAAPHFAGAMALLMSAAPSWFPPTQAELDADPTLKTNFTADQALELFQTYAIPFTATDGSAAGFLDTFEAFNNIAAPSAKITELVVEDGVTPSTVPFTVKIIGEFLPDSPDDFEIRFDDQ
ncbi:MAG: S8 family serine peptidase, partial [Eudoraea sp.]|nr:S8 family serine peptidase [Eudoraea sp.]